MLKKILIAKVALRFSYFKNLVALVALRTVIKIIEIANLALRFMIFKNFCAFLRRASIRAEKMPTSGIKRFE